MTLSQHTSTLEIAMMTWSGAMVVIVLLGSFKNRLGEWLKAEVVKRWRWPIEHTALCVLLIWLGMYLITAQNPVAQAVGVLLFAFCVTPVLLRWVWGLDTTLSGR